ncbi:DUF397 domain-containing protein [Streptomyces sulphureus]|uniref:DUF397 domain-containing protein n=1 Tax=Streptomyces sulphureus TaxID=47758 RepID=UPI00037BA5F7|nr:DUF397 domain-containing protein [Streptomyces sulphureus]
MTIDKGTDVNLARATWRKSSYSQGNGACIEVADGVPSLVPVRDSKDTARAALVFPSAAWSAFVAAASESGTQP